MVPIFTLCTRDPAKPLMDLVVSIIVPLKSSIRCEMHPEHRLSTPMFDESVSKLVIRAPFGYSDLACIEIISMQQSHVSLPMFLYFATLLTYFISFVELSVVIVMTLHSRSLTLWSVAPVIVFDLSQFFLDLGV